MSQRAAARGKPSAGERRRLARPARAPLVAQSWRALLRLRLRLLQGAHAAYYGFVAPSTGRGAGYSARRSAIYGRWAWWRGSDHFRPE